MDTMAFDVGRPFEKGDVTTLAQALEVSEFVLQGVTNAYRNLIVDQTAYDPEDAATLNLTMLVHETVANGVNLAAEWRKLAETKRRAEALAEARAEFEAASAELHKHVPGTPQHDHGRGWNGR